MTIHRIKFIEPEWQLAFDAVGNGYMPEYIKDMYLDFDAIVRKYLGDAKINLIGYTSRSKEVGAPKEAGEMITAVTFWSKKKDFYAFIADLVRDNCEFEVVF